jgi:hypothetical protein
LLGAPVIGSYRVATALTRRLVVDQCATSAHLLIDPDTGLAIAPPKRDRGKYLFMAELIAMVDQQPRTLRLVYDQSHGHGDELKSLHRKLQHLRENGVAAIAYRSHTCFVAASRNSELVAKAHRILRDSLALPAERLLHA